MGRHIVLLGLMGSGKTSIGRLVADRLGLPLVDGDDRLAAEHDGRTAAEIADERGLATLHELEAEIALHALAAADPSVIGPAASVCEVAHVRDALAEHHVIWLTAPPEHLAANAVKKDHRPLVNDGDPVELFTEQLAIREPLMVPLAGLVVDVSTTDDEHAAEAIVAYLRDAP